MKKQSVQMLMIASMQLLLVGSIMSCKQKADAPSKEITEAAEEASRQVPEQGEMKPIEPADSANQAHIERLYFEALVKIADGGKVYATDSDGKRGPKAFTRFVDYSKFIADNPQYPKNHFSYDAGGQPFNIDIKPSPNAPQTVSDQVK